MLSTIVSDNNLSLKFIRSILTRSLKDCSLKTYILVVTPRTVRGIGYPYFLGFQEIIAREVI